MGKRIVRIFSDEIKQKLPQMVNNQLTVILKNKKAIHGNLVKIDESNFCIKFGIHKTQLISIDTVQEIQVDINTEW